MQEYKQDMPLVADGSKSDVPIVHIKPSKGWVSLELNELWYYRELLYFLVWRDIKVRYKQTILGASWAIIQPFFLMVVFSVFFGGLAGIESDSVPYPLFNFAALVPWTFFANGLNLASNSLVNNANMVKKIYFPRLMMPTASILAGLVDFCLAFGMLLAMIAFFHFAPASWIGEDYTAMISSRLLLLPLFLLLALLTSLGGSLWLSAMNVQFRDVRFIIPFVVQLLFFLSPIAYPTSLLENDIARTIYGLNPMATVVDGFRWALVGTEYIPEVGTLIGSIVVALFLFFGGLFYFRRMEKTFADVV